MKNSRGFTFVELLVVVTIIAVLSGIGIASFTSTNQRARDSKRKADLEAIRSALEICRSENGAYPAGLDLVLDTQIDCGGTIYLNVIPLDPRDGQAGYGYEYTYATATTYTLCALQMEGENETSPYCVTNP